MIEMVAVLFAPLRAEPSLVTPSARAGHAGAARLCRPRGSRRSGGRQHPHDQLASPPMPALPFPDIDENDPMYEFFRRFFRIRRSRGHAGGRSESAP
jgi:hypothetical protein